jgi:hypothetical protein
MGNCAMTEVHYFPRYSQRENFETNNTLLLLNRLYDYSRLRFERFLAALLPDAATEVDAPFSLGLQIKQQIGTGPSIVDGYLYKSSFKIVIETKRSSGGFYADQLIRHLAAFKSPAGGALILLSPEGLDLGGEPWSQLLREALDNNVAVISITFQGLIAAIRGCLNDFDEEMTALLVDYEAFCSEQMLLPVDKWTIFVPPCGRSNEINVQCRLYFCPASWSRREARYLGIYYDKAVRQIGTISKVVDCEIRDGRFIGEKAIALTDEERARILRAAQLGMEKEGWDLTTGHKFFLCDDMRDTLFRKSTPRGIQGHRYFDLRDFMPDGVPSNLPEIAERLASLNWS